MVKAVELRGERINIALSTELSVWKRCRVRAFSGKSSGIGEDGGERREDGDGKRVGGERRIVRKVREVSLKREKLGVDEGPLSSEVVDVREVMVEKGV